MTDTRTGKHIESCHHLSKEDLKFHFLLFTVPDIVELDLSKDGDVCNNRELNEIYQQPYNCKARKAVGLEKLFLLHLDCDWNTNRLASALSNNSIYLSSVDTLEKVSTFVAHDDSIVDIHFNPTDPNCLFSASGDGTIRLWDWRTPGKHTQEFKGIAYMFVYKNSIFSKENI